MHRILFTLTVAALATVASTALAAPANDNFANAQIYTGISMTVDNTTATAETGEPDPRPFTGSATAIHSLWWQFTPTISGFYQIDTVGSGFDTVLALYTGSTFATLNLLASDDDTGGSSTSLLKYYLVKGTTYRIQADGWGSANIGSVKLNIKCLRYFPALTWQGSHVSGTTLFRTNENGVFSCTLTNAGLVTGKLLLGGKTFSFTAAMGDAGAFNISVPRAGFMPVNLAVTSTTSSFTLTDGVPCSATNVMNVNATDGANNIVYSIYPAGAGDSALKTLFPAVAPWSSTNPCPRAGRYNMTTTAAGSAGHTVASVTVSSTGTCTGSGNLGDGTAFTFAVPLLNTNGAIFGISTTGSFCFASSLYSSTGLFTGKGAFDASVSPTRFIGNSLWVRQPSKSGVALFPAGIFTNSTLYGSRYTAPPANTRIDASFDPMGACTFTATNASLPSVTQGATLSTLNKFSYSAPNANLVSLTLTTSTGIITGSTKFTGATAASAVKAIFISHPLLGANGFYGYVPGTTGYGAVTVNP